MMCLVLLALLPAFQDPDVDALLKQLEDDSVVARDEAVKTLIEMGDKAVPKLKGRMATAEGALRRLCSQIIEKIAIPKNLRGVLPPITRVTIDAKEQSVQEVFEEFQLQTRLPMRLKDAGTSVITVKIDGVGPLEALEAICRAANLGRYYPSGMGGRIEVFEPSEPKVALHPGPELRFSQGYVPKPRVFVRHYDVELWELILTTSNDFRNPRRLCEATFTLHCAPGVSPHVSHFEVHSLTDDRGNQLLEGPADATRPKGWGDSLTGVHARIRFRYPDKGIRALSSIRGTARLFYPLEMRAVTFEPSEKEVGVLKEIGGRTAKLVEFKDQRARFLFDAGARIAPPFIKARLKGGKIAGPLEGRPVKGASEPLWDFYLQGLRGELEAMEVVVDMVCAEDAFDFEFKDVVLP